ncbi:hypothetical protein [Paenibacillus illinoisensis]|uniref:Uncharacterized protein n=1 Tax=Paenibacillus illinoisensis TaxID=59845 RepID=A0A2W0CDX7_9BACL|nr:hypothetical protein [Paenibacillus illinoisensis]PYY28312.1 hypothetical protein PIL02S_03463 [Paenibacillus illinoisensis]
MKRLSTTSIYMTGILGVEKNELEEQLEKLVDSVKDRRDYDNSDFKAIHSIIKEKTTRYVQLINELDTLSKLPLNSGG